MFVSYVCTSTIHWIFLSTGLRFMYFYFCLSTSVAATLIFNLRPLCTTRNVLPWAKYLCWFFSSTASHRHGWCSSEKNKRTNKIFIHIHKHLQKHVCVGWWVIIMSCHSFISSRINGWSCFDKEIIRNLPW